MGLALPGPRERCRQAWAADGPLTPRFPGALQGRLADGYDASIITLDADRLADIAVLADLTTSSASGRQPPASRVRRHCVLSRAAQPVNRQVKRLCQELVGRVLVLKVLPGLSELAVADMADEHTLGAEFGAEAANRTAPDGDPDRILAALRQALAARGYEPYNDADGTIRLRNCPFDRIAAHHRELVCEANLAMLEDLTDHLGGDPPPVRAVLDPQPGRCCVALTRDS
jgi:hypothetical protein